MSETATPSTPSDVVDPANEPGGSSDILLGAGQGAWLTLVTVVAGLALALSIVALVRDNGSGGAAVPPSGPVTEITFAATEFAFAPSAVTVVADTDVAVALDNEGALEHNWVLLAEGVTVSSEDEIAATEVAFELPVLAGGESASDTMTLAAGSYQFVCTITGHFSAGMAGTLTAQ
jgi:uncharacterized cupredoxin-like copper-binding protein